MTDLRITVEPIEQFELRRRADNKARRRISGIIAPYGEVVRHKGKLERFEPGVFTRNRSADEPMPVLFNEDHKETLGVAIKLEERAEGLWAEFEVANTLAAQEALELADLQALWAFSAGWVPFETRQEGAVKVHTDGGLRHASLTSHPQYRTAVVQEVREEQHVTITEPTPTPPDPAAEPDPAASDAWSADVEELREELTELRRQNDVRDSVARQGLETRTAADLTAIRTAGEYIYYKNLAHQNGGGLEVRNARERIEQATEEVPELRAAAESGATADFVGMVPEIYVTPLIDLIRKGSPSLNALERVGMVHGLPAGFGLNIHRPKVSQGTIVAWEGAQGDEPNNQKMITQDLVAAIKAVKGRARLTLQAALRTSPSAIDAVLRDIGAALIAEFNRSLQNGSGVVSNNVGELLGWLNFGDLQDETIAAFDSPGFIAAATAAEGKVWAATNMAPLFWVMHSRRFSAMRGLRDANAPLMTVMSSAGSYNAVGSAGAISGGSPLGGPGQPMAEAWGYPVVIDNSTPTDLGVGSNEDIISLVGAQSIEVYHEARRQLQFQSPDDFQTTFGLAKLGASMEIRGDAICTISGPGLAI